MPPSNFVLSQAEADRLMALPKIAVKSLLDFPLAGERLAIELTSIDKRERFTADVNRSRIKLTKCTYQERDAGVTLLVRLDIDGPPHTNPDGVEMPCPHLHIYREGDMLKWAQLLPGNFSRTSDLALTLQEFLSYCRVDPVPTIQENIE